MKATEANLPASPHRQRTNVSFAFAGVVMAIPLPLDYYIGQCHYQASLQSPALD